MKKLYRAAGLKLAAFILCLACVAGAAATVGEGMVDLFSRADAGEVVYQFERSVQDSYAMQRVVNNASIRLYDALVNGETQEAVQKLPEINGIEYYARKGNLVYSNTDKTAPSDFTGANAYIIRYPDSTEGSVNSWGYYRLKDREIDGEPFSGEDIIMVRLTERQYERISEAWNASRLNVSDAIRAVLLLFIIALVGFIYLLFVTGRRPEDEDVHLVLIDRMGIEAALLIAWIAVMVPTLALVYFVDTYIYSWMGGLENIALFGAAGLTCLVALLMELILSQVRNLKNHSFVENSLICRFCRWGWKLAKKLWVLTLKLLRRMGGGMAAGMRRLRGNMQGMGRLFAQSYSTRKLIVIFALYSVVLVVLAAMTGIMMDYGDGLIAGVFLVAWIAAAGYLLVRRVGGFENIVRGLRRLRSGETGHQIEDCPMGVLQLMADDINSLGEGMKTALQNEVRAERMKSELITNVSHDLKTPLTSILNYADLLCKEELRPEEANDYAKIIYDKGMRLKNLTADLFDISKVQSGAEVMQCERLDLCTLVRQALAEQERHSTAGELQFKVTMPEGEVGIWGDGQKLSRVLENLLGNCVKYALAGTRVFVSVEAGEQQAAVELKNIASYEMDFDGQDITDRFVRGDAARSTEGSGLGLAIAKGYAEACGGALEITVDGDLFKATVRLPRYE